MNGWDEAGERLSDEQQAQYWLSELDRIYLKAPIRQFLTGKRGALTLNAVKSKGLTVGDFRAEAHTYAQSQNVSTTAGANSSSACSTGATRDLWPPCDIC